MLQNWLLTKLKWLRGLIILTAAAFLIGGCTPPNQPPVIYSLTAAGGQLSPSQCCQIECVASDPDGDELNYTWSASGGGISGEGSVVSWVAPDIFGTYAVTVTVIDGRGGQAIQRLEIVVTCCL